MYEGSESNFDDGLYDARSEVKEATGKSMSTDFRSALADNDHHH